MNVEFITSTKGKRQILFKGFVFNCYDRNKKVTPIKEYWRCCKANVKGIKCKAKLHTQDGIVVVVIGDHCRHSAETDVIEKKKLMNNIKKDCLEK